MYPASDWSIAPGHHGYQRACDLISGQASSGAIRVTRVRRRREDRTSTPLILSQTSAGKLTQPLHAIDQAVASLLVSKLRPWASTLHNFDDSYFHCGGRCLAMKGGGYFNKAPHFFSTTLIVGTSVKVFPVITL